MIMNGLCIFFQLRPAVEHPIASAPTHKDKDGIIPQQRSQCGDDESPPKPEQCPANCAEKQPRDAASDENRDYNDANRIGEQPGLSQQIPQMIQVLQPRLYWRKINQCHCAEKGTAHN